MATAHTPRMTVRRFQSAAEADRHDGEFWWQVPPPERVLSGMDWVYTS
ncbi:MAG: hypothetical protein ABL971_14640 [Vicinamibacterales bacterium]